jgi:hypothetical protein
MGPTNGEQGTTAEVAEQGSELKAAASEQAGQVASTVKEQAGEVARDAVDQGRQLAERARSGIQDQARARTAEIGDSLHRLSGQVQALADGRPDDAGPLAGYVTDAAGRVGDLADRVDREGFDGVLEDVAEFGRRRPGAFLLSAGLAGFVVGRAIRAGRANSSDRGSDPARATPSPSSGAAMRTGRSVLPTSSTGPAVPSDPALATRPTPGAETFR